MRVSWWWSGRWVSGCGRGIRKGREHTIFAREEWLAAQHLRQNAADAPDVDSFRVFFERKHDFGSAVPACCNVFGHEARVVVGGSS